MRDRGATYLLLAPAALIFGTLFILPLAYFLVISFWRVVLFKLKPDLTIANYLQVFELHLPTLLFTLGLALVIAVVTTCLGFVYAYLIRFKAGRFGPVLLFVALITLFGGYLMKIYSWMTILGITGVLNTALKALGLISEPLPWLFYNVGAVVLTLVNFLLPLAILPIYGALDRNTQKVAFYAGDKKDTVVEVGIQNLTQEQAPILIHFPDGRAQQYLLVRLPPKEEMPAGG